MSKLLVVATLILVVLIFASVASATGWHHVPHIVDMPVVTPPVVTPPVAPPVVTPPAVVPPATPTAPPPATPAQQPVGPVSAGGDPVGPFAFAGVAIFFYFVICTAERGNNPGGFWAKHLCLDVK